MEPSSDRRGHKAGEPGAPTDVIGTQPKDSRQQAAQPAWFHRVRGASDRNPQNESPPESTTTEAPADRAPANNDELGAPRARILQAVRDDPGLLMGELRERVAMSWGTLQHHVRILVEEDLVRRIPRGRATHVFPTDRTERAMHQAALLRTPVAARIATKIRDRPGSLQRELCEALGITRRTFRRHADLLEDADLIHVERGPLVRRYRPTDALGERLAGHPDARTSKTDEDQ